MLVLLMAGLACQFLETPTRPRPTSGSSSPAPGLQLRLAVAPVAADIPGYDRDEWRHWNDVDRDCQNARHEVLIEESTTPVTFKSDERCRVATGNWTGPYTATEVDDPSRLDIDHMVPLANAHRSGGWAWDRDRKAAFANDLEFPGHLIATTAKANRAKGADGPEDWRPSRPRLLVQVRHRLDHYQGPLGVDGHGTGVPSLGGNARHLRQPGQR